ncbi:hypothetical protein TSAR_006175 [Trichomalopsis sarcophagae]|uniref:Glutathione synthetase n=1 Tax=Trichomalopsis sarcophagae TaxID=543379 RepID=A0A232EZ50_9HYME|nr:hypothetical protein TSAR_006175 [Trichomalopsis sarcophagae]
MTSSVIQPSVDINLPESELKALVSKAKDWMIMNGASMRSKNNFSLDQVQVAPFLLLPSMYPKKEFEVVKEVQPLLNELMHKVAHDYEFLRDTLKSTIEVDSFTSKLFNIYDIVHSEGFAQNISLGLIRSDYMLHSDEGNKVKQVEINMIASSFAALAVETTKYHKFVLTELGHTDKLSNIPANNAAVGFATGLAAGWQVYNNKKAVILVVVEEITYNFSDQRKIEFKIQEISPDTKIIRRTLTELHTQAQLGPNKELFVGEFEIAVVYYRSGYELEAYPSEKEWEVRLLLERSRAIKCPSIQYHLAGTKKVQQQLAVPGVLERFYLESNQAARIREVFVGLYSLDLNEDGEKAVAMAIKDPAKYVLKPQREGGGNNVYGEEIKARLEAMGNSKERTAWILMDRIHPPLQKNYLIRAGSESVSLQDFVSELGIYGIILADKNHILMNNQAGHVLRTKPSLADEGGIVSGAGALDCPFLVG